MREITMLEEKVGRGEVRLEALQKMLAFERKILDRITMPTEALSIEHLQRQEQAEIEMNESRAAAKRNIPILERLITKLGGTTDTTEIEAARERRLFGNVDDGPTGHGL